MYITIKVEISEQRYSLHSNREAEAEIVFEADDESAARHLITGMAALMQGTAEVALDKYARLLEE